MATGDTIPCKHCATPFTVGHTRKYCEPCSVMIRVKKNPNIKLCKTCNKTINKKDTQCYTCNKRDTKKVETKRKVRGKERGTMNIAKKWLVRGLPAITARGSMMSYEA